MNNNFKIIETFEGPKYIMDFEQNVINGNAIVELEGVTYIDDSDDHIGMPLIENEDNQLFLSDHGKNAIIKLDADILSKHLLIIGGIGMGKTNTFNFIVNQTSKALNNNDIMLIFDTKGDFYKEFGSENDIVISNNESTCIWNIFNELSQEKLYETSNEIAAMLFAPHVEKSSQSFFPLAAKSIFASTLRAIYRLYSKNTENLCEVPSNALLKDFFLGKCIYKTKNFDDFGNEVDPGMIRNIFSLLGSDPEEKGSLGYISEASNDGQTLGVLAELRLVIDELFIGNFGKKGDFSITKAFRERNGKRIFLEYDIVEGNILSPIYSLLVDLAIKESLSPDNNGKRCNSYFIIDEFKLLPNLKHMDDAVNFGRSLGIKFIIGVQNVSQIKEAYGEDGAMNILSGFSTTIAYKVSDHATRKYLVELFGVNRKRTTYMSAIRNRGVIETLERANVVEEWDILSLDVGECIVRLPNKNNSEASPFFFKMLPYENA